MARAHCGRLQVRKSAHHRSPHLDLSTVYFVLGSPPSFIPHLTSTLITFNHRCIHISVVCYYGGETMPAFPILRRASLQS